MQRKGRIGATLKKEKQELERWLFLPDTHAPYHDKRAWSVVLEVLHSFKFYGVVILGDFFDCYAISDYRKDPRRERSLRAEIIAARKVLAPLEAYPFKERIFVEGNHEWRLERYLQDKAPELYEEAMQHDLFGLEAGGWKVIPYMQDTQIGALNVTHDIGLSGMTSTRKTMLDYGDNSVIGHNHNLQYFVEGNAKGVTHVGASFGWLGDRSKVDYKHQMKARKEWALGFGTGIHNTATGAMYLSPHPILNDYTCCVDGRIFTERRAA
jgi:hypothetical protein